MIKNNNSFHPVIAEIVAKAKNEGFIEKIILFGSRARGDHRPDSDIDLAFSFNPDKQNLWISFKSWIDHDSKTLLSLDLVNLNECSDQLKKQILKEGLCIYEKS